MSSKRNTMLEVTPEQARSFILDIQGLRTKKPPKSIIEVAHRIHSIQIDTISVVSRSHNLITWNRYPKYREGDVWNLQRKGKLFEYWSHSACLLPMEAFPFYAWRRSFYPEELWSSFRKWGEENKDVIEQVYKKVKKDGATNSASMGERKTKTEGWWDWKIEKRALEYLYTTGKLMVAYRENFQKHYDLAERVIPPGTNTEPLSNDEAAMFVVKATLGSLGLGSHQDIRTYLGRLPARKLGMRKKTETEAYLNQKVSDGLLEEVSIGDLRERHFVLREQVSQLSSSDNFLSHDEPVKILSPFDNIIRERHYPAQIWNFDYKIECFVPKPKRVFGYFVLPILDGIDLAGRMDAKVHRKTGLLEIKSLYLESDSIKSPEGISRLKRGIDDFAQFHACEDVKFNDVKPKKYAKILRS
ncbi:MAG: winged helix-turn-helix domain-containing protein [Candidatus Thorarchaeota archaeon]